MGSGGASRKVLTFEEARARVEAAIPSLAARRGTERVPLDRSFGHLLAAALVAPFPSPRFPNSAVDGYAIRAEEIRRATASSPVVLPVTETVAAGSFPKPLPAGHATLVMTGAPVPEGADCVVPRESTEERAGAVAVHAAAKTGQNVRPAGEDAAEGETILPAGRTIGAAEIAALGAFGLGEVEVVRRPRVAILSTGDELKAPGERLGPGEIYDSNSHAMRAWVWEAGGAPTSVLRLPDHPAAVAEALRVTLAESDLVLSIGGVSMGDFDAVKIAVAEFAGIELWRVGMRPGGPQAFGVVEGTVFHGLPGNPVSSAVVFDRLVRPLMRRALGAEVVDRPVRRARLAEAVVSRAKRRDFLRVRLEEQNGDWLARLTGTQSSGAVTSLAKADGLAVIPEAAERLVAGAPVDVIVWRSL